MKNKEVGKGRSAKSGQSAGVLGSRDAREFKKAAEEYRATFGATKEAAIESLKRSGYLTKEGKVSDRYR